MVILIGHDKLRQVQRQAMDLKVIDVTADSHPAELSGLSAS